MDSVETLVLTITPTEEMVSIDGVWCRAWCGATADGTRCMVFVHRIGVAAGDDATAFEKVLMAFPRPRESDAQEVMRRAGL